MDTAWISPGKVQVDIFHRRHLSIAAAGRATLHAKARPQRGFSETYCGAFADAIERVAQANGGGGFAFTGRGRVDSRYENQFARIWRVFEALAKFLRDFGFDMSVVFEVLGANSQLGGDFADGEQLRLSGEFYIG